MRIYIAVSIVLLVLAAPYIAQGDLLSLELQRATVITGSITATLKPNTPVGGEEAYLQRVGTRDISIPIIGIAIGSLLVVLGILYRYAYKRFYVEKNRREGVHGRMGEG